MRPAADIAAASLLAASVSGAASAETLVFRCTFDWKCDPNRACGDEMLDVRYRLDTDTNRAERIGATGPGRIDAVIGDRAVTLVETPISGGVTTTTILLNTGDAVHSPHIIDSVSLKPLQYLGNCVALAGD